MHHFLLIAICLCFVPAHGRAYERFVSPNGRWETYTTANHADGTGMKLLLRRRGGSVSGVEVASNDRWLEARWSPDSRFLAVANHHDGHMCDVLVFGVSHSGPVSPPTASLFACSSGGLTYDLQWKVAGWDLRHRNVLLTKTVKFSVVRRYVPLRIGRVPLSLPSVAPQADT